MLLHFTRGYYLCMSFQMIKRVVLDQRFCAVLNLIEVLKHKVGHGLLPFPMADCVSRHWTNWPRRSCLIFHQTAILYGIKMHRKGGRSLIKYDSVIHIYRHWSHLPNTHTLNLTKEYCMAHREINRCLIRILCCSFHLKYIF